MEGNAIQEQWVGVHGTRTRYLEGGAGEHVVFVHGGFAGDNSNADCAELWDQNYSELAQQYHCIAVDRLGQGFTENPIDDGDYAMAGSVRHLICFLEMLDLGPVHIIGHSEGALAVAQITLQRPDLIKSSTLASSGLAAPGSGRGEFVRSLCPHPAFSQERARYMIEQSSFKADHITSEWFSKVQSILNSEKHRSASHNMIGRGLFELRYINQLRIEREAMFGLLERQSLPRPVMLFWGYNDPLAPIEQAYRLYDLLAKNQLRCQLHVANQAGHYAIREQPSMFNRVLANFVEDVCHGV